MLEADDTEDIDRNEALLQLKANIPKRSLLFFPF